MFIIYKRTVLASFTKNYGSGMDVKCSSTVKLNVNLLVTSYWSSPTTLFSTEKDGIFVVGVVVVVFLFGGGEVF